VMSFTGPQPRVMSFTGPQPRVMSFTGPQPRVMSFTGPQPRVMSFTGPQPRVMSFTGPRPRVMHCHFLGAMPNFFVVLEMFDAASVLFPKLRNLLHSVFDNLLSGFPSLHQMFSRADDAHLPGFLQFFFQQTACFLNFHKQTVFE
jgi:hypothetical protein